MNLDTFQEVTALAAVIQDGHEWTKAALKHKKSTPRRKARWSKELDYSQKSLDRQTTVVGTSELTVSEMQYIPIHSFIMRDFKNKCVHMHRHNKTNSDFSLPRYKSKPDLSTSVKRYWIFVNAKQRFFLLNTINPKDLCLLKKIRNRQKRICL